MTMRVKDVIIMTTAGMRVIRVRRKSTLRGPES